MAAASSSAEEEGGAAAGTGTGAGAGAAGTGAAAAGADEVLSCDDSSGAAIEAATPSWQHQRSPLTTSKNRVPARVRRPAMAGLGRTRATGPRSPRGADMVELVIVGRTRKLETSILWSTFG